jgi:hypothetical protein
MAEESVRSRKPSGAGRIVRVMGADGLFTSPWPGPGNSEGPVDPDRWSVQPMRESSATASTPSLLAASPWPGPGDSEA